MSIRNIAIYRACIRYRNPETGRRHFCHEWWCREHFLRQLLAWRAQVRQHDYILPENMKHV